MSESDSLLITHHFSLISFSILLAINASLIGPPNTMSRITPSRPMKNVVGMACTRYWRLVAPSRSKTIGKVTAPIPNRRAGTGLVVLKRRVDAQHDQALIAELLIDRIHGRHLGAARRTPTRPQIQHHHLAAQIGQRDRIARQRIQREVGRSETHLRIRRGARSADRVFHARHQRSRAAPKINAPMNNSVHRRASINHCIPYCPSAASICDWNASAGCAPTNGLPLMKNVGVPVTPTCRPFVYRS